MKETHHATRVAHFMMAREEFRRTRFVVELFKADGAVKHGR